LGDKVEGAFVFGSTASGQAGMHSDIDVLVVGDVSFSELVTHLYPIQEKLGREINPKLFQLEEWERGLQEQSAFVRDVLAKPKLFLKGSDVRFHQ
jgi:predicted nucleotidyltransferase